MRRVPGSRRARADRPTRRRRRLRPTRRARRVQGAVSILTTVQWHGRSREELTQRYKASADVPEGVQAFEIPGAGETIFWIPEHRALVPGDRILGDRPPGLRLCPESWLRYLGGYTLDDLRAGLQPLLELPVELVLVSHGEPVLENGHGELERALA